MIGIILVIFILWALSVDNAVNYAIIILVPHSLPLSFGIKLRVQDL